MSETKEFPIIELFTSIQGEGIYAGVPSVFVRCSGCNLRCCFKGSICDTPYSSYFPEKPIHTHQDVINEFISHKVDHLVITGGEPMLYQEGVIKLINEVDKVVFKNTGHHVQVTIETNATILPKDSLLSDERILWSMSPKLSTSEPNAGTNGVTEQQAIRHKKIRINVDAMRGMLLSRGKSKLKFVYSDEESFKEIKLLIHLLQTQIQQMSLPKTVNDSVMLMPEGITNEQLQRTRLACANHCIEEGWLYTDRLHIVIWGDKRGV